MLLKALRVPMVLTVAAIVLAGVLEGGKFAAITAILIVLEVSLSFDNAVVNATIVSRMNHFWRQMFLTVGVLIAVFGMRLVFPIAIVSVTAQISPAETVKLALNGSSTYGGKTYGQLLGDAHPAIAAFGGLFLLMLFLDFIFEEREITWLTPVETLLAKVGKLDALSVIVSLAVLIVSSQTWASKNQGEVLVSGAAGIATYLAVNALSSLFEEEEEEADAEPGADGQVAKKIAQAGLFSFLYLEVLDASFSFDGVIGAFAVTDEVLIIALGLGVGALYIRELTVYLVEKGTLSEYRYLEHGAHYAIGALAILLVVTTGGIEIPEVVTGLIGVGFIGLALVTSLQANKKEAAAEADPALTSA